VIVNVRWVVAAGLFCLLAVAPKIEAQYSSTLNNSSASLDAMQLDTTGPVAFKYKGVTIFPVGYFAAEGVFRSRNETADIGSSFNAIPFGNTTNGRLTEFRGSARQSRLAMQLGAHPGDTKITAYFESDFLSSGTSSNSVESNSYTFRVRQFWARAVTGSGLGFTAGQMFSLMTLNRVGTDARMEDLPNTIDAQYVVGFDWTRGWQMRVSQNFADHQATIAFSAEAPQMTVGGHGAPAQTFIGNAGGSLLNATANYSTDVAPDAVLKLALDPKGFGHYELKALGRIFRDRVVDPNCEIGCSKTAIREGGGIGAGMYVPIVPKYVDFSLNGLWGTGVGRYGTSMLPDVVVRPNGIIQPVLATSALGQFDIHATHRLELYVYGGVEYAYRTTFQTKAAAGAEPATYIGYGSPTANNNACDTEVANTGEYVPGAPACAADTKAVWEITPGFWYRFYRGNAGTIQWGMQYAYVTRNTWSGLGGYSPLAIENMVYTSFRYYFP